MKTSFTALALLLMAAGLVACGGDESPPQGAAEKDAPKKAAAPAGTSGSEGGLLAQDQWRVVIQLEADLDGARGSGRIAKERADEEVLESLARILENRLRAAEVGQFGLQSRDAGRFDVGFVELAADRQAEIVGLLTRAGTLEFLIEVLTDEEYQQRSQPGDGPGRTGLWRESAAAFAAFKLSERAVWRKAETDGARYQPTRSGYRLLKQVGADGSEAAHFHVLEVPTAAETFDGRMIRDVRVSRDMRGRAVVAFGVKEAWQKRFGDWTEKNLLMPMALVLDGEWQSSPFVRARLDSPVQISLGSGSDAQTQREAKSLAAVLRAGTLPVALKLLSIEKR
jgi:preprotein translocase subunit SecD